MEQTTPANATNHYRRNVDKYAEIRERLAAVRKKFDNAEMRNKVFMLQKSHAFAVLSVQTNVSNHEKAFMELFADGFPLSEEDIRGRIDNVNYYNQKSEYIWDSLMRGREWEKAARMLQDGTVDEAHKFILDTFKGVGPAKAPFVLAMLGFTEKMCIDTNVAQLTERDRPSTVVVERYENEVDEIKSHFPTLVDECGSSFLFQWILFDYKRGDISFHDVWFHEMGVI